jgi:GT2 family glycosyltransferase
MRIIISIPIYISNELHAEFTEGTVKSIKTSHDHEIVLINNFCAPEYLPRMKALAKVIPNIDNNVSLAWNLGINYGIEKKADYILIPNNDLIFRHDAVDNLIKFARFHPEFDIWTAAEYTDFRTLEIHKPDNNFDEHPHFSCFMVSPKMVELLKQKEEGTKEPLPGYFDTNYRIAYFEDQDMVQRIYRTGLRAVKTGSALFYHFGSRTIKTDNALNRLNLKNYEDNRQYFKQKWGYDAHEFCPKEESDRIAKGYKNPFNS